MAFWALALALIIPIKQSVKVLPLLRTREELQIKINDVSHWQHSIHERLSDLLKACLILFVEILN